MITFKNDSQRLSDEFELLKDKNPELYQLVKDLADYVTVEFGKDIVITMIYRTQREQDRIYNLHPKYQKKPWKSPHQFYTAIDIRSRTFTQTEVATIENYLDNKYNESNYYKWTAKCHAVIGNVEHFHIQYTKKN